MTIAEAQERIINDGIDACKKDYANSPMKLKGSINGFKACRGKTPEELKILLCKAQSEVALGHETQVVNYWEILHFYLQVEWVCNVLSAILANEGLPIIIDPTCRGSIKAAEIVGIKEKP